MIYPDTQITAIILQIVRASLDRNAKRIMIEIKHTLPDVSDDKIREALEILMEKYNE
jgi:hypothetical protein